MYYPSTPSNFISPSLEPSRHFDKETADAACFSFCWFPSEKLRKLHFLNAELQLV